MLQTSVEIVNPGGTGRPALVISARPDPLPPSRSFMFRLPSALPLPKKKTCFFDFFDREAGGLGLEARDGDLLRFAVAFFAMLSLNLVIAVTLPWQPVVKVRLHSAG